MTYYKMLKTHKITISKPGFYPTTFYRNGNTIFCDTYIFGKNYPRPDLNAKELNRHIKQMIIENFKVTIE